MTIPANDDNQRPVWFVSGGTRWKSYLERGYWRCFPSTHNHSAPVAEITSDMQPGDRIALKEDRFRERVRRDASGQFAPSVGIWATGEISQNNLPDSASLQVRWDWSADGVRYVRNCPVAALDFRDDECIWRLTRDTDAGRAFIAEALGESIVAAPELPLQPPTYTAADIISDGCFLERPQLEIMLQRLHARRNIILQGPPGTGKTWLARRLAYALVGSRDDDRVRPLQFHANMSYENFVRGWRPSGDGRLELVDGPFLRLIDDARQDPDAPYVMVIEEINRGNPAQIFGEMLTLLEADQRHPGAALALAHPDPGVPEERVYIPPNVYVIGTMNVADRSLALVDFALRRRFAFFDLAPVFGDAWRSWVSVNCGIPAAFLSDVARKLTELNDQIAADPTLGRQFRIGHSVVTPPPGAPIAHPSEWFQQVEATEIAPLLAEYWFDRPETADAAKSKLLANL